MIGRSAIRSCVPSSLRDVDDTIADPGLQPAPDPVRTLSISRIVAVLIGATLLVGSCARDSDLDAPPPPIMADELPPPLPLSTMNVPVSYDLSPIILELEEIVPRTLGDLDERQLLPSNRRVHYAFQATRQPFRADLDADTARLSTIVHYRGRGWYDPPIGPEISASCGTGEDEDAPRALLAMSAPMDLDSTWTLRARSRLQRIAPVTDTRRDQCRITFAGIDITERVLNAVGALIRDNTDEIDRAVAGVNVRKAFEKLWLVLQNPIALTDGVWLLIQPVAVRKGRISGDGLVVTAEVGLTAAPQIVAGRQPAVQTAPLPPLRDAGAMTDGLHVLVEGVIQYELANRLLDDQLIGRIFERGGHQIRIEDVQLSGIGAGRLALQVTFDGSQSGRIYFVGKPHFDAATNQVSIPDLDIEIASAGILVASLAWLGRNELVEFLRERARFPVDDPIVLGTRYLSEGLNRNLADGVRLSGTVIDVQPLGVYATRTAIFIRARAEATARLVVSPEPASAEASTTR